MQPYFKDKITPDGIWQATTIHVPHGFSPYYRLLTGGKHQRFMLTGQDYSYFCGAISYDFYQCYVLFNPQKANEYSPFRPINSQDIEQFTAKKPINYWQYWSNFYAKQLANTQYNFLYAGDWWIVPMTMHDTGDSFVQYDEATESNKNPQFSPYSPFQHPQKIFKNYRYGGYATVFEFHIPHSLACEQGLLHALYWLGATIDDMDILLYQPSHLPSVTDGRVKWWRKKIRENRCPPLLVWYQSQVQGYLLMDGYARLQAYFAENIVPDVLVISPITTLQKPIDEAKRTHILQSLKNNLTFSKTPIPIDKINHALIQAFDNNQYFSPKGQGKPIANLDEIWQAKLYEWLENAEIDKNILLDMIKGN